MSAATNSLEDLVIQQLFRTGSWTKPTIIGIALFTAAPGEAGGGTEVSGGSYARVAVNPLDANWAATSGGNGLTSNVAAIVFPTPSANWGTITHFAIFDNTSGGTMLIYGTLTTSKTVNNGDPAPQFNASALTVTVA